MALSFTENRQRNLGLSVTSNTANIGLAFSPNSRALFSSVGLQEATEGEAITGTLQNRYMSPLRVQQKLNDIDLTAGAGLTGGGSFGADLAMAVGAGTGITVNSNDVALDTTHVRNVDHSAVTMTAGTGLTGGGTIEATRTLALDTTHVRNVDHSAVTITAGAGLTGGGTIESTRTLNVVAGAGITVNADDVTLDLASNNIWTGHQYFKNGRPWADVRAWGAVGNGSTDDTSALQAAIDYMNTNHGGGIVFFPPGTYKVSAGGILVKGGCILMGCGVTNTAITVSTDSEVVTFDADADTGGFFPGMNNLFVVGYNNVAATKKTVFVEADSPVVIRDCYIWLGKYGLYTQGVDGFYDNCFISGYDAAIYSLGANWYSRVKADTAGITSVYAFFHGDANFTAENHFDQCDFSGTYTDSINIDDGNNNEAITVFTGCVFSSPVRIVNGRYTSFVGCEFGSTTLASADSISVVGSYGLAATTVTGAGTKALAGNINIT